MGLHLPAPSGTFNCLSLASLACLATAAAAPLTATQGLASGKPNVLFIVSDDLRPEMGVYGGEAVTPNVDKLASSPGAVVFERSYVQQAICCPTRSSFLTGRRPDATKVWDLHTHFRASGGRSWKTLPEHFKDHGYFTAGMGKVFHPVKDPLTNQTDDNDNSWTAPYYHPGRSLGGNMTLCWTVHGDGAVDGDFRDTMIAQHAVETLRNASKAKEVPFFVAVGIHRPHLPWDVPAHYYDLYPAAEQIKLADHNQPPKDYGAARNYSWDPQSGPRHCGPLKQLGSTLPEFATVPDDVARHFRLGYYAAVSSMDYNAGLVLDELSALNLQDSTVVIFLGDHGWQLGDVGEFGKKTNFEAATRTPLIIRTPPALLGAKVASGGGVVRAHALVEFVDIMPTLVDIAGLPMPPLCPPDSRNVALCREGESLLPVIKAPATTEGWKKAAFMQYPACMHDEGIWHDGCAKSGPQFGPAVREPKVMGYAMRTRRWRYIEWVPFDQSTTPPTAHWAGVLGRELYDFTVDDTVANVAESVNLAEQPSMAATVKLLSAQLHAGWRKDAGTATATASL